MPRPQSIAEYSWRPAAMSSPITVDLPPRDLRSPSVAKITEDFDDLRSQYGIPGAQQQRTAHRRGSMMDGDGTSYSGVGSRGKSAAGGAQSSSKRTFGIRRH
mmetsp:Transcript_46155/g.118939  ORF Transcript_46155/g.118939 Transcript_46155/m.118939 type:complete len:102 (+) Transcript_46155:2268-2573(+)